MTGKNGMILTNDGQVNFFAAVCLVVLNTEPTQY